MKNNKPDNTVVGILFHLSAILAGIFMMVLGVGLGVTMVLLPVGIPVGLVGLLLFICGLTPGCRTS